MSKAHLDLLAILSEQYPAAFPQDHKAIRPLKIGIHEDLQAALPEVSHAMIRKAMVHHTRRLAYLRAMLCYGERIDLQGQPAGSVTPEQQAHAKEKLKDAQAHLKAKKEAQGKGNGRGKGNSAEAEKQPQAKPGPEYRPMRPVLNVKRKPA